MTYIRVRAGRRRAPVATAVFGMIAALGTLATLGLSGCALVNEFTSNQKERVFATIADAPTVDAPGEGASAGGARADDDLMFVPPAFVPTDATDLKIRVIEDGPGAIVRFTSASPLADESCEPGALTGSPLLESTWWPAVIPADGIVCGSQWQVFQRDGYTYAWASV
jgi:hypothetical protein